MATRSKNTDTDIEIKDEVKVVEQPDTMDQDVIDIEFKELQKQRFRLDRDNDRVIELNLSDLSVISRLEQIYPRMLKFVEEAQTKISSAEEPNGNEVVETLTEINQEMKELLNYAFDSDVADKACPDGTLFDPINGKFRFEYIIERLVALYDKNFNKEFELMQKRVDKHTAKYTKKRN